MDISMDSNTIISMVMSVLLGVGLSAAVGFKVFLPFLIVGVLTKFGVISVGENFEVLSSWTAIIILSTAALVEIGTSLIPGLDNALDTIAVPVAVVAGTIMTATLAGDFMDPAFKWAIALIAGGGTAGIIKMGTAGLRVGSTAATGGLATPVLAAGELGASLLLTALAFIVPILCIIVIIFIIYKMIKLLQKIKNKWSNNNPTGKEEEIK